MSLLEETWTSGGIKFYWFRKRILKKITLLWERVTGFNPYNIQPSGLCPVQADGTLKDGNWYYFRARGTNVSLEIYPSEEAFGNEPYIFYRELEYGHTYEAGYLLRKDAIRLATVWLNEYFEHKQTINLNK